MKGGCAVHRTARKSMGVEFIIGAVVVVVFIILCWWISTLNGLKKTPERMSEAHREQAYITNRKRWKHE